MYAKNSKFLMYRNDSISTRRKVYLLTFSMVGTGAKKAEVEDDAENAPDITTNSFTDTQAIDRQTVKLNRALSNLLQPTLYVYKTRN